MGGVEELREQARSTLSTAANSQRLSEICVYERVMYKNKNQHRRAPYFQRMDHVRRTLKKLARSHVWNILEALSKDGSTPSFSSVTVDDVDATATLVNKNCSYIIPAAARCIVEELVSRAHFVPFSVTVLSMLARLYVIERRLYANLVSTASKMRLLLALEPGYGITGGPAETEDVGERVVVNEASVEERKGPPHDDEHPPSRPFQKRKGKKEVRKSGKRGRDVRDEEPSKDSLESVLPKGVSLYDLLAPDAASGGEVTRHVLRSCTLGASRSATILDSGASAEEEPGCTRPDTIDGTLESSCIHETPSVTVGSVSPELPVPNSVEKKVSVPPNEKSGDMQDTDEIDDIFGLLD